MSEKWKVRLTARNQEGVLTVNGNPIVRTADGAEVKEPPITMKEKELIKIIARMQDDSNLMGLEAVRHVSSGLSPRTPGRD